MVAAYRKWANRFYNVLTVAISVGFATVFGANAMAQTVLAQPSINGSNILSSKQPCRYHGKFEQSRALPGSDAKISAQGEFLYSCKQGLLWEVREPVIEIMVYTHKGGNFRIRKSRKVRHLQGPVDSRIGQIMLGAMSGNAQSLEHEFDIVEGDVIELIPRSELVAKRLNKITIEHAQSETLIDVIAAATGNISIRIFDVQVWDITQIEDTSQNTDAAFCGAFSLFPKPVCRVLSKPNDYIAPKLD